MVRVAILLCAAALLVACGSRAPVTAHMDAEQLLYYGQERLEAERWDHAIEAFEAFLFRHSGHRRQGDAHFLLGEAHFGRRQYLSAANEFVRVASDFAASPFAETARFRACESYARLSPAVHRDQQYTQAAIDHCDVLVTFYPDSEHAPAARAIITEMVDKLAYKQYRVGEHYLRRRAFDPALLSYQDVLDLYPASSSAPRALMRMIEIYDRLGYDPEREATQQRLLRDYPASAEARALRERSTALRP
jgi:outer membrane protein assembly factor BamD